VRVKLMTWVLTEQSRRFRDSRKPDVEDGDAA
jgi:hypothetical protein